MGGADQTGAAALTFGSLPIAALAHSNAGLFGTGVRDPIVLGVDLGFVTFGILLSGAALVVARNQERRAAQPARPLEALELSRD